MMIIPASVQDHDELLNVWEVSVRATHDFLGEDDIQAYKQLIGGNYFENLDLYFVKKKNTIAGFIGLQDKLIQMLFVHPAFMKQGIGKTLINFAILERNVTQVDVNEQNAQALRFYKSLGFEAFDRFETDHAGKPFPILSLSLKSNQ
ncbi:GNAT family N-acetyltransferase [Pedobacter sp. JCM 36344]|uniref:GNAT family N-acetyltransferase n=1 Tax=Pedobacter sp. JCM 36344 TaxID=3374280 RepID=UPI0039786367